MTPNADEAVAGRVWRLGDDITTDALAAGKYMKLPMELIATHCLEEVRPEFAGAAKPGDIVVAGNNFGIGSAREMAPLALKHLGVDVVLARSFAGLFYRNALNLGLVAIVCTDVDRLEDARRVRFDLVRGEATLVDTGEIVRCVPMPPFLLDVVRQGGLIPHLKHRLRASAAQRAASGL